MSEIPLSPRRVPYLPVFVYGTLRPGEKNYPAYLGGRTLKELSATVEGKLYFVAEEGYPYLLEGKGTVRGEAVFIDPARYDETLLRLDELEEYDQDNEKESVYLRRRTTVRMHGGSEAEAWAYYWNRPEIVGKKVESGDFKNLS